MGIPKSNSSYPKADPTLITCYSASLFFLLWCQQIFIL